MNIRLLQGDCLELLKGIPDKSVDLVITDPPYVMSDAETKSNALNQRFRRVHHALDADAISQGYDPKVLDELVRVMKNINIYIWCNKPQLLMYLKHFVEVLGCKFEILAWHKTNAAPLFNHKYLVDKEYCLYFYKGGHIQPINYEYAKTVWHLPLNKKDKNLYGHPTIKPLEIIERLVMNSSHEGDTILDCFMGSGTTGVAAIKNNRQFIGMEINETYFDLAKNRIEAEKNKLTLF